MTAEAILASGISALICHGNASSSTEDLITDFEEAGKTIDIICLGWEGMNCLSTALMMGIFFQVEDAAHEYVDWCNGILNKLKTAIDTLDEDDVATVILPLMYTKQSSNIRIECEGTGSYSLVSQIANVVDLEDATYETKNRAYRTAEWFLSENENGLFDYILIMEEGSGLGSTNESYNARFEASIEYFVQCPAYEQGRIGGTTYGFGGFSGFSLLTYVAFVLYPQLFTEDQGLEDRQYWFDNFTNQTVDVNNMAWRYTGTAYEEYVDRMDI